MSPMCAVLAEARALAVAFGVVRAAEITQLDIIGVPVYSVARPTSLTLTVHTGKGMTCEEAEISGLLEAVEYACAERIDVTSLVKMTPTEAFLRFGVSLGEYARKPGHTIGTHDELNWVMARSIANGTGIPVPVEVVYMPCRRPIGVGAIASTSVGMACGVSTSAAALHGLCEVVERHLNSFDRFVSASEVIGSEALTGSAAELRDKVQAAGLTVGLRGQYRFGLYYVDALIYDPCDEDVAGMACGICCKTSFEAAARGALLEAVQSRLTLIHGGRDDLDEYEAWKRSMTHQQRRERGRQTKAAYLHGRGSQGLEGWWLNKGVPEAAEEALGRVVGEVSKEFERVLVHEFDAPSRAIKVVRVIVPGMEQYMSVNKVMGSRLVEFLKRQAEAA